MDEKVCTECKGKPQPLENFHKRDAGALGRASKCKKCVNRRRAERYKRDPKARIKAKDRARAWQKENPERFAVIKRRYLDK